MQPFALALPTPAGGSLAVPAWLVLGAGCVLLVGCGVCFGVLLCYARIRKLKDAVRRRDERIVALQRRASKAGEVAELTAAPGWGGDDVAEDARTVHLSWSKGEAAPDVSDTKD